MPLPVVMKMPPSLPLTCQPCVRPVTAVRARLRIVRSRAPTCTKPPSGIHTPTYFTTSPRSVSGSSVCASSNLSCRRTANSRACPSALVKSSAPTCSRRALCVSRPFASATQISSTPSSPASARRRRLDSSGSAHHASSRISRTRSRTAAARRSMRPSTRSRMWTATSSKTLSTSRRISFCDIRSWSVHVSTIDAANASATAPTRRQARRRCPSVLMARSFPRWPRPARP